MRKAIRDAHLERMLAGAFNEPHSEAHLNALPVQHVGHSSDLVREEYDQIDDVMYLVRWWRERDEEATWPCIVEYRDCPNGSWEAYCLRWDGTSPMRATMLDAWKEAT